MQITTPPSSLDKTPNDVLPFLNQVFNCLTKGLTFEDNVNCQIISFTTNVSAGTNTAIEHKLGRIPSYFIQISSETNLAYLYRDAQVTKPWTDKQIFLKCTVASAKVTVLIF